MDQERVESKFLLSLGYFYKKLNKSRLFEDETTSVKERTFWEKPKEVQRQDAEPLLSVCHRGCVAVNENKFKVPSRFYF